MKRDSVKEREKEKIRQTNNAGSHMVGLEPATLDSGPSAI